MQLQAALTFLSSTGSPEAVQKKGRDHTVRMLEHSKCRRTHPEPRSAYRQMAREKHPEWALKQGLLTPQCNELLKFTNKKTVVRN